MSLLSPENQNSSTPGEQPYKAIGYDHGRYGFEVDGLQIVLRPDEFTIENLARLASLDDWRRQFPEAWDLTVTVTDALLREAQAAGPVDLPPVDAEVIHFEQWTPPPPIDQRPAPTLSPACSAIAHRLFEEPPPRPMLATIDGKPFLPQGVVGAIGAAGGVGKTMFSAHLADAASKGGAFGPIHFPRPLNVLFIALEDDQSECDRRLWKITGGYFSERLHVVALPGCLGPIMELDTAGNPRRTKWFDWLDEELALYQGSLDMVIIDPYSRINGLPENSNECATAFVNGIETLRDRHDTTILLPAHCSQESSTNPPERMTQNMLRGATGLVDGVRWVIGMRPMTEKLAKKLNVENRFEWIEYDLVKANYVPKPARPYFLRKNEDGTLDPGHPAAGRLEGMTRALVEVLADEPCQYTVRDLEKNEVGKDIEAKVTESAPGFSRRKDTRACLEFGASRGWLEVIEVPGGRGSTAKKINVLTVD